MIKYVKGDATNPCIPYGVRIIAHVCNNVGKFGAGFAGCVAKRWGFVRDRYVEWSVSSKSEIFKDKNFALGAIQIVPIGSGLYIANMIAQNGVRSSKNPHPINYMALGECLKKLDDWVASYIKAKAPMVVPNLCPDVTIHMPRIGCGLAGGSWDVIEPLIGSLINIDVYVYDLE